MIEYYIYDLQPIYTVTSTKDNHVNAKWSWKPTNPQPNKSTAVSNPSYTHAHNYPQNDWKSSNSSPNFYSKDPHH